MQCGFDKRTQRHSAHVHITDKGVNQRVQLDREGTVGQPLRVNSRNQTHIQNQRFIVCRGREVERSEFVLVTVLHLALVAQVIVRADRAMPPLPAHDVRPALITCVDDDRDRGVEAVVQHHHGTVHGATQLHLTRSPQRHLIELVPYDKQIRVACSSHAKGKAVTTACELGCIGCKKCEKNCPSEAITVTDFCAHIDYDKCTGCGKCKEVCPRHVIL